MEPINLQLMSYLAEKASIWPAFCALNSGHASIAFVGLANTGRRVKVGLAACNGALLSLQHCFALKGEEKPHQRDVNDTGALLDQLWMGILAGARSGGGTAAPATRLVDKEGCAGTA